MSEAPKAPKEWCGLTDDEMKQCCCNCVYLRPVHYHCSTEPKPPIEVYDPTKSGRCVCGVQKGYACTSPETDRVYDCWPLHSIGCELYTPKLIKEKLAARKSLVSLGKGA